MCGEVIPVPDYNFWCFENGAGIEYRKHAKKAFEENPKGQHSNYLEMKKILKTIKRKGVIL